ncbi:MAG: hypothetical protein KDJ47_16990 [Hyphomicrobiaceae bacterium]|nr:hypothetical protein [Hyphomicrobiaceae bacterium]
MVEDDGRALLERKVFELGMATIEAVEFGNVARVTLCVGDFAEFDTGVLMLLVAGRARQVASGDVTCRESNLLRAGRMRYRQASGNFLEAFGATLQRGLCGTMWVERRIRDLMACDARFAVGQRTSSRQAQNPIQLTFAAVCMARLAVTKGAVCAAERTGHKEACSFCLTEEEHDAEYGHDKTDKRYSVAAGIG